MLFFYLQQNNISINARGASLLYWIDDRFTTGFSFYLVFFYRFDS